MNFINLSTARSIERAKEVGVRKVIGAMRKQLILQFMIESLLINFISSILSILVAIALLPVLNYITGNEVTFVLFKDTKFWSGFVAVNTLIAIIAGLYPAFVLSSFKPLHALKGNNLKNGSGFTLRKSLVVFQFLISAILISGTLLVYKQIAFMKNQDLGVDMQQVLVVKGPRIISDFKNLPSTIETFKFDALNHPSIMTACGSGTVPGKGHSAIVPVRRIQDPTNTNKAGSVSYVDFDFFTTFEFQFLAGRPFDLQIVADRKGVIINEEAVVAFGLGSPELAIQENLIVGSDTLRVMGILKNYHWNSLRDPYAPCLFVPSERARRYFSFKVNLSDIPKSISTIESSFKTVFPGNPFEYFFLDDDFNRQYQNEVQFVKLFSAFSILAITIGCLGLFALVSFSTTLRTKEIGIRKVLGAGVGNIMILLSREYILLLLFTNILAVPVILYAGQLWLDRYAFRTTISTEIFIISGSILLVTTLLTLSNKFYSTANSNPINALRKE